MNHFNSSKTNLCIGLGVGTLVGFGSGMLAYHFLSQNNTTEKKHVFENDYPPTSPIARPSSAFKSLDPEELLGNLANIQIDNVSATDAIVLNYALHKFHGDDQVKIINMIIRAAAFTRNMTVLRESNCLKSLLSILHEATKPNNEIMERSKLCTVNALVSLACDVENQKMMKTAVSDFPTIMQDIEDSDLGVACLKTLSNLSLTNVCHEQIVKIIPYLYKMMEEEEDKPVLHQVLNILLNLSCEPSSVPHLLAARAPENMVSLISGTYLFTKDNGLLETFIRFLKNLFHEMKVKNYTTEPSLGGDMYFPVKGESMLVKLQELRLQMKAKVFLLTLNCEKEELAAQAKAFYDYLQPAAH